MAKRKKRIPVKTWKIQRPIVTNDPTQPLIVYDRGRTMFQMKPNMEMLALFDENEFKVYVRAKYDAKRARFGVLEKLPTQDW